MKWQPTPVFLPGKPHELRSLTGYSPGSHKRVRHNSGTKQQQRKVKCGHWGILEAGSQDTDMQRSDPMRTEGEKAGHMPRREASGRTSPMTPGSQT